MGMNSTRLQPLLQLADSREQDALRRLAERQHLLIAQEDKLVELQRYLEEYLETTTDGAIALVNNRHAFVARLREAVHCQQRLVEQARIALDTERAHWLGQRQELGVLDQLAQAYRGRERRQQEKRMQAQMDDNSARHALRVDSAELF